MRKKEGNKERAILDAAVEIFAEQGYHNAKISKIAERASVATGSIYVYFQNKEDILLKVFEEIWQPLYVELNKVSKNRALTPLEKIEFLIDIVFDFFIKNPAKAIVFVNEQNHLLKKTAVQFTDYYDKFMGLGENIIKAGIRKKAFNKVDVVIFKYFILGGLRNLLNNWAENPKDFSLNKIRKNVKYLLKNGLLKS